jgi:hypothetical protein
MIMALSRTVTTPQGFTATGAYHRVEGVSVTKTQLAFRVRSYVQADKPAFGDQAYECAYDLTGENPIRQAYLYLKTLPEWADAADA